MYINITLHSIMGRSFTNRRNGTARQSLRSRTISRSIRKSSYLLSTIHLSFSCLHLDISALQVDLHLVHTVLIYKTQQDFPAFVYINYKRPSHQGTNEQTARTPTNARKQPILNFLSAHPIYKKQRHAPQTKRHPSVLSRFPYAMRMIMYSRGRWWEELRQKHNPICLAIPSIIMSIYTT
jgi:hypothetical protein